VYEKKLIKMSGGNSTKKGDSVESIRDLIIDLGGTPKVNPDLTPPPGDVKKIIENDLAKKESDIAHYKKLAQLAEQIGDIELKMQMEEHASKKFAPTALDRARRPRNNGPPSDFNGHARITGPSGNTMEIWLAIWNDTVARASFTTTACRSAFAWMRHRCQNGNSRSSFDHRWPRSHEEKEWL
jgi:hypothetical protein